MTHARVNRLFPRMSVSCSFFLSLLTEVSKLLRKSIVKSGIRESTRSPLPSTTLPALIPLSPFLFSSVLYDVEYSLIITILSASVFSLVSLGLQYPSPRLKPSVSLPRIFVLSFLVSLFSPR
ncbi:hypothetical protein CSUI_005181 [Cystoisospora suis]|uniref:Transmembrane protein n=1 Tax=Cystoisospora suis TaxID=483139 RepID=A0A2C6KXZ5_9APIC|nr:hypothetical protein CSUI_005181 [Cystoisospora suis]